MGSEANRFRRSLGTGVVKLAHNYLQHPGTFKDCVDEDNMCLVDRVANPWWRSQVLCWEVKGRIADELKDLAPKIVVELQRACKESSQELSFEAYMLGKSPQRARPVIVIASEDQTSREEAKTAIKESGIMTDYPYFKLWTLRYLPTGPVHPVAARHSSRIELATSSGPPVGFDTAVEHVDVYYDSMKPVRAICLSIYIKQTGNKLRRATANAVFNGTEYGYLTTKHVLQTSASKPSTSDTSQDHFDFPSDIDTDSETDFHDEVSSQSINDEILESKNRIHDQEQVSHHGHSLEYRIVLEEPLLTHLEKLGTTSVENIAKDCTIIRVTNETILNFLKGFPKRAFPISAPRSTHITARTSHGLIHGRLLETPLYMRIGHSGSFNEAYKFTYRSDIKFGDSGSLIIDSKTHEIYGTLIADTKRQKVAFMVSLSGVLGQVNSWNLVTMNSRHLQVTPSDQERSTVADEPANSEPSVTSEWTWDSNHKDYYYVTVDVNGIYTYHWSRDHSGTVPGISRSDSLHTAAAGDNLDIRGTPELGPTERLDSTYWMRTGEEAQHFFRVGKVFSMLHVQAASETELLAINDNISIVKYGERAFAQIRKFVIVDVRRGFVYACPISTYRKRGTLKTGCIPSQHSVIYVAGSTPAMFQGERERGLVKAPICVVPSQEDPTVRLEPASRIHYAKAYLIEMNVKVKDIGDIDPSCMSLLLQYYREESSGMNASVEPTTIGPFTSVEPTVIRPSTSTNFTEGQYYPRHEFGSYIHHL